MKTLLCLLVGLMFILSAHANTYTITSGKWTDTSLWHGHYIGNIIKADDEVIITGQVTMNISLTVLGTLTIEKGASLAGMKDLTIAKNGHLNNNGNTVMRNITNEETLDNSKLVEAMTDMTNRGAVTNDNVVLTGNNFDHKSGNVTGNGGTYYINNTITISPTAKFGNSVKVLYGNSVEQGAMAISTPN